jgi:hypothetical protein
MTVTDPGLIDWQERVYLSQFSAPPLTLTVYIAGQPGDPDGQAVTGRLFMDNPDGTTALVDELTAVREQPGVYVITPTSADTQTPGYAQLDWAYAIGGRQQQYASYLEIGPANPSYDALPPEMQDFLNSQVWVRFADVFDSAGGGPNLQAYFQAHWSRGRAAQMMGIALQKINAAAQPWSSYTLDGNGGPQYPIQFWGGLLASYTYVECVKQLIRAYTEQPQFMGPPVARQDRRDYADRWREVVKDETAELKGLLDVFKIRHILNGSPRVLVSGGTYGNYAPTRIAGSVAARPRMWARWYLVGMSSTSEPGRKPRYGGFGQDPDNWKQDIASLYVLQDSLVRMPTMLPSERRERERIYRDSGELTRETIMRLLLGEFS